MLQYTCKKNLHELTKMAVAPPQASIWLQQQPNIMCKLREIIAKSLSDVRWSRGDGSGLQQQAHNFFLLPACLCASRLPSAASKSVVSLAKVPLLMRDPISASYAIKSHCTHKRVHFCTHKCGSHTINLIWFVGMKSMRGQQYFWFIRIWTSKVLLIAKHGLRVRMW